MDLQRKEMIGTKRCVFTDLGLLGLPRAEALMVAVGERVGAGEIPEMLLFLAHPPTVAVGLKDGKAESPKDLLVSPERLAGEGIALVRSVRGGGITYHWPGQVVCYPVLRLSPVERNISAYMTKLEDVGIATLKRVGLTATRRRDSAAHIGLWVDGRKIVSMGIRVSRWVTSFGFAMNLDGDFSPSRYIRPCGIDGVRLTSIEESLGEAPSRSQLMDMVKESFVNVFQRALEPSPPGLLPLPEQESPRLTQGLCTDMLTACRRGE
jgi:lipoate-protein ligase B